MFARKKQAGHILLVVLVVVSLISLSVHNIIRITVLEYQRIHNQLLDQQLWQKLEFDVNAFIKSVELNETNASSGDVIGFVADTLEVGCKTGIMLHTFMAKDAKQSAQLVITYSIRK